MAIARPDRSIPAWSALVLDEGQPACAEGVLIHRHGRPGLVADNGAVPGSPFADTWRVPLQLAADVDLSAHEGNRVLATGTLRDGHLVVAAAAGLAAARPHPGSHAAHSDAGGALVGGAPENPWRSRPRAERALLEQGMLVDCWTDEQTGRRVALAVDAERVRAALTEHYGDTLDVVQSRWGPELSDEVVAAVDEDLLLSFGNALSPDRQLRVAVTLLHLPGGLARRLERFPTDALAVEVLVKPHPAGCTHTG